MMEHSHGLLPLSIDTDSLLIACEMLLSCVIDVHEIVKIDGVFAIICFNRVGGIEKLNCLIWDGLVNIVEEILLVVSRTHIVA